MYYHITQFLSLQGLRGKIHQESRNPVFAGDGWNSLCRRRGKYTVRRGRRAAPPAVPLI